MQKTLTRLFGAALLFFVPLAAHGATLSTPITVSTLSPAIGGTATVSGSCGNAGAASTASFSVVQNGVAINLATTSNLVTDSSGNFNGTITFPSTILVGQGVLTVKCDKSGDTLNSPTLTFGNTAGTPNSGNGSFTLPTANPTVGGVYSITGTCTGTTGTADVRITSNGVSTTLNTFTLNSSGGFSGPLILPNGITAGAATLIANCSNGTTFQSPVTVGPVAVTSFISNATPALGTSGTLTGTCVTMPSGQSGTAMFSLLRNGISTQLDSSNTTTNSSGQFTGNVTYPATYGAGAATLVITCPGGTTFASPITLVSLTNPTGGSTDPLPGSNGAQLPGGVVKPTPAPTGGVNAGEPASNAVANGVLALALALGGVLAFRLTKKYSA